MKLLQGRIVTFRGARPLRLQELQRFLHEGVVVLKDAPVPGVVVQHELGIGEAAREIDRVAARHHLAHARIAFNCLMKVGIDTGVSRFSVRSFSRRRKSRAARRPFDVSVKKR